MIFKGRIIQILGKDKSDKIKKKIEPFGCGYVPQKHLKAILNHEENSELKFFC